MDRGLVSSSKSKAVRDLISGREAEMSRLEMKMLEIDYEADSDISQHWHCIGRSLRPTKRRKHNNTNEDTILLTTKLLEEQEPIHQRVLFLRRANQLSRAFIAAVHKVPDEVLSLIFREYVDMNLSVWDLVDVCAKWQDAAFGTPHLWSTINITWRRFRGDNERIYHYRRSHLCSEQSYLKTILGRCGSVPLDVTLDYRLDQSDPEEVLDCIKVLNSPTIINRT
ncbi:hypothetical protein CPB86DRAFT_827722 [Serendipita vermifera]|nr:hypothetical protein CPB86DRAFT_827722 [Serendipita vermifera]